MSSIPHWNYDIATKCGNSLHELTAMICWMTGSSCSTPSSPVSETAMFCDFNYSLGAICYNSLPFRSSNIKSLHSPKLICYEFFKYALRLETKTFKMKVNFSYRTVIKKMVENLCRHKRLNFLDSTTASVKMWTWKLHTMLVWGLPNRLINVCFQKLYY